MFSSASETQCPSSENTVTPSAVYQASARFGPHSGPAAQATVKAHPAAAAKSITVAASEDKFVLSTKTLAKPGSVSFKITNKGHEPHNFTHFYVQVDDVKAYLDKAIQLGGKTLVPPVDIPTGTFAWFADPEGNTVGLWKPKP